MTIPSIHHISLMSSFVLSFWRRRSTQAPVCKAAVTTTLGSARWHNGLSIFLRWAPGLVADLAKIWWTEVIYTFYKVKPC
jgi:hypothetical protein